MEEKSGLIRNRSEEVQEVLTAVPRWMIRWGSSLFFVLVMLLFFIAWIVKYPDIIVAEGLITTQIPLQKEYANVTARIDTIFVKDSELVDKNTILAILENTADSKDILYLKSILDTIEVENKTIEFPIDDLPLLILGDVEQSYAEFENNYNQYLLNKTFQPFNSEALANATSVRELQMRLQNLRSQYELKRKEFQFISEALKRNKILYEKGVIAKQDYEDKVLETLVAERSVKSLRLSISQAREAISNSKKLTEGTEFNRNKEELVLLKKSIQSFNQLKKALRDWENLYALKSKIKGNVTFFDFWSSNQNITQGDIMFAIIPEKNSDYLVKVKAPSNNAGKIKKGQFANIKLLDYPDSEFGTLKGEIKNISLTPDKDGNYLIDLSLSKQLITSYNKRIEFKPEMRGNAEIITEDLRLIQRFFYQFREVLNRE